MAVGLNEHYREIFVLTRLNEMIPLDPTEAAAQAALNSRRNVFVRAGGAVPSAGAALSSGSVYA